jgi:hypothetical protein
MTPCTLLSPARTTAASPRCVGSNRVLRFERNEHADADPSLFVARCAQGIFVKRHKVTRDDGSFFDPTHFAVGAEISIYGRTFYLVDADTFTRDFYQAQGVDLDAPMPYPDDPVDAYRTTFGLNRGKTGE